MSQENVDLITGGYDDFNGGKVSAVISRFDSNVEWVEPGGGQAPSGTFTGAETVAEKVFASVPQVFEEFTCELESARDEGDTVVTNVRFKGKNRNGIELDAPAEHVWEVRGGKVVRFENKVDQDAWAKGWSE